MATIDRYSEVFMPRQSSGGAIISEHQKDVPKPRPENERILHRNATAEQLEALRQTYIDLESKYPGVFIPRSFDDTNAMEEQRKTVYLESGTIRTSDTAASRLVVNLDGNVFQVDSSGRLRDVWSNTQFGHSEIWSAAIEHIEAPENQVTQAPTKVVPGYEADQGVITSATVSCFGKFAESGTKIADFVRKIPRRE
jgi:hypothetical protein